jgi:hypothetical protein
MRETVATGVSPFDYPVQDVWSDSSETTSRWR